MKKNQITRVAAMVILISPCWGSAQTMALQTISASGASNDSGANSLSWTVGEAFVMAAEQGDVYLGAGFQQAKKRSTLAVGVFSAPALEFRAYPNPTNARLTVQSNTNGLVLRVYNLLGQQMLPDYPMNGIGQLDFSQLSAGTYFLQAIDEKGHLLAAANIQHLKIN